MLKDRAARQEIERLHRKMTEMETRIGKNEEDQAGYDLQTRQMISNRAADLQLRLEILETAVYSFLITLAVYEIFRLTKNRK